VPHPETPLANLLAARIAANGPFSVAEFMAEALGHRQFGYYRRGDPLGAAGDFTTAPEISQMFGELVGLWCVNCWLALGRPTPFVLAELGPGRGTLMADALRALDTVAACRAAARIHLVETSPALRVRQRAALPDVEVCWHDRIDDLPMLPTIWIANEFFDALPIEQFVCQPGGWRRRLVDLARDGTDEAPRFIFSHAAEPCAATDLPAAARAPAPPGAVAESSPSGRQIAAEIARRIRSFTGAALIVDYGYAGPAIGDTLQAVRAHQYAPVLDAPGMADLTAHVDFAALAEAAGGLGAACWGPITQGEFLRRLGIEVRAQKLAATATPAQRADIDAASQRLIGDAQMGTLFKVMALAPRAAPPPAGFLAHEAQQNPCD